MSFDFSDLLEELHETPFTEMPVSPEEFCYGEDYLDLKRFNITLSPYQMQLIKAGTQIYHKETLYEYLTPSEAQERWEQTFQEIIMVLGKGSGKDFCSTLICAYIIYLLMCLKDPQNYYGKPPGDFIDIMNIAINSDQAKRVFFDNVVKLFKRSKWFRDRYDLAGNMVTFPEKNIRLVSGHSKSESLEGFNVLVVILDEISGFDDENTNSMKQITADSTYAMHSASVTSRFTDDGKLILLSFPRHRNCFISRRYREVVAESETVEKTGRIILDEDQDPELEGNYIDIEWEEDHIIKYAEPRVFALKRPSWEVNPTKKLQGYRKNFMRDPVDALSRFACMPPESVNAFFKDRQAVENAFSGINGIDENGQFYPTFVPRDGKTYYMHVDLAQKHDRCVVTMAHVDRWTADVEHEFSRLQSKAQPVVVVDLVKYWEPKSDQMVDFNEVREFILSVRSRGFDLRLVTFDQWRSEDFIIYLNKIGVRSERLSANNPQYYLMSELFGERRVTIPDIPLAVQEYLQLRPNPAKSGKIDHPSKGSDDLAVCIAGACFNAVTHTERGEDQEIEIVTYTDMHKPVPNLEAEVEDNVIRAPKSAKHVQKELADVLTMLNLI